MDELIKLFKNQEFGDIRLLEIDNKAYFVANDVAKSLGYLHPKDAVTRHCRGAMIQRLTDNQGFMRDTKVIPEGDVYRLVVKSELPAADKFESWIFDEVIPSIRNNGVYATQETIDKILLNPDFGIKLLTQLKEEQEKNKEKEKQLQLQQPKVEYVDKLLKSETSFSTTELAADFGISAIKLNKILIEKKIIRKLVTGHVLCSRYLDRGYQYMLPIEKDGKSMRQLRWTERGRAFIHYMLDKPMQTQLTLIS